MFTLRISGNVGFEFWQDIQDYEGCYQVSTYGRVRSMNYRNTGNTKLLSQGKNPQGYLSVVLKGKNYRVHRLVATTFLPNFNNEPIINHKDCDPSNNFVENLEWCSYSYNNTYGNVIEKRKESIRKAIEKSKYRKTI